MRVLVTGCAGFIGSHLCEALIARGYDVVGVDSFDDFYNPRAKQSNISALVRSPRFRLVPHDLSVDHVDSLLEGTEKVFHLAARPGVRGDAFHRTAYLQNNVTATKRLLEAVQRGSVRQVIYASSSSVYGNPGCFPTPEDSALRPLSVYGETKLQGERLVAAFARATGRIATVLRFFTVYGPRQRPDMAFHRFMRALIDDRPLLIHGDGHHIRDFTFVADIVGGIVAAAELDKSGTFNLAGARSCSLQDALETLRGVTGIKAEAEYGEALPADAQKTTADLTQARRHLDYRPQWDLERGLAAQWKWFVEAEAEMREVVD